MPVKRRILKVRRAEIPRWLWARLIDDDPPPDLTVNELYNYQFPPEDLLQATWREHGEAIVAEWAERLPGTRPWGWWECSSPRLAEIPPGYGPWVLKKAIQPRRRVGGRGNLLTGAHVCIEHDHGIPTGLWYSRWHIEYYNGRLRDVNGRRIGTEYHEGNCTAVPFDPRDPPTYEPECAYLARHDLLTPAEVRVLPRHAVTTPELLPARLWPADEEA